MKLCEKLVADSRFPWSVRQQRGVEKRDERLGHRFNATVRGSTENSAKDHPRLHWRLGPRLRPADRFIDQLDELPGERDAYRDSIRVSHAGDGSLNHPAEMQREPIGRLGGPQAAAARVEVVTEVTEPGSHRFCNEDFVQTARTIAHSYPIRPITMCTPRTASITWLRSTRGERRARYPVGQGVGASRYSEGRSRRRRTLPVVEPRRRT